MKEVGRLWNQISENDLEKYKDMARKDLERFKSEHSCFVEKINLLRKDAFFRNQTQNS